MIEAADPVVVALASDLADGVRSKPVRITASSETARRAADYWRTVLAQAGMVILRPDEPESDRSARIHLHDQIGGDTSYSPTGLAPTDLSHDLVGEVIGQGDSDADRYSSLVAVADALAGATVDPVGDVNAHR